MKVLIIIFGSIGTAIFLYVYLAPFILNKYKFYLLERTIKKIAKNHTGETKDQLNNIADLLKEVRKEEKL